jgi:hypothetical protein
MSSERPREVIDIDAEIARKGYLWFIDVEGDVDDSEESSEGDGVIGMSCMQLCFVQQTGLD